MKKYRQICLLFLVLFIGPSYALTFKELGEELMVPVTTDAKYVLGVGSGLTLGLAFFKTAVVDPFQEKQVRNKTLGSSSTYGDVLGQLVPNILYVGGMSVAGYYGDPEGYKRAIGMFKATAYSAGVTTLLKYTVREPRPNDKTTLNSFPSGHTTSAFAFSGYVAAEHGWAWGAPALLMSTFVAHSRINDNAHYLHDVIAGATIGWAYGWGISKHAKKKSKVDENEAHVTPIMDTKTIGIGFYKEF